MEDHMRSFYSRVLGLPQTSFVAILDGTYLYIQVVDILKCSMHVSTEFVSHVHGRNHRIMSSRG